MGLSIAMSGLDGKILERIDDPRNVLHRLLPPASDTDNRCLAKIDWYGDTYFNYLQIPGLLAELDELGRRASTGEESTLIVAISELAVRCSQKRFLLRFIGD
jgi:hypothetical protein